nr:hypothetical protein [Eimeria tenella]
MRSTATPSDNKNSALSGATPETEEWQALAERIADAQRRLRLHLDDLNYIRLYPVDEPYVALFPVQDTEDSQEKRKAMRLRIFQMLVESRQGEDGKSDDEPGGDDMFVDVQGAAEDEATLADPFEEAHPLSDNENDKGRGGVHRLKSKGPQAKPTNHPHGNARTTGNDATRRQGDERAAKGPRVGSCGTSKQHLTKRGHRAVDRSSTQQKAFQLHEQVFQHKRRDKEGSGWSPKEIQQQRDGGSTAARKGITSQPTRIGLSKHKAPNQHLMFDSDEE